jgi:hypothetical protein
MLDRPREARLVPYSKCAAKYRGPSCVGVLSCLRKFGGVANRAANVALDPGLGKLGLDAHKGYRLYPARGASSPRKP